MPLTDRKALDRNRARAKHAGPVLFLQEDAAHEVIERLALVNRAFTAPAIVTPWPEVWSPLMPGANLIPDTDVLELQLGQHDLVIHALCLHWAEDPVGQLIQARRALQPDGLFLATTFGGHTLHELRAALAEAETKMRGGLSPRVLPMAEIRDLGGLLQRAGFALPVADSYRRNVSYRDCRALMRDLRAMGEANALSERLRTLTGNDLLRQAERIYRDAYGDADARICATFEVLCLTGWAPGPGQPQALRPGSATTRLAEALNTSETALDDPATPRPD